MNITAGMMRRGYVECDGYSDTHGFKRTGKQVWVEFRPGSGNDHHNVKRRGVWVDYLGDYFVLNKEGEHFERLSRGCAISDWDWVEEGCPNVLPERMRKEVLA